MTPDRISSDPADSGEPDCALHRVPAIVPYAEQELRRLEAEYGPRHPFLVNPEQWLEERRGTWENSFTDRRAFQCDIGCADPGMNGLSTIRYPGLGINEDHIEIPARKILALQRVAWKDCEITLLTHDDCKAAIKALGRAKVDADPNEYAEWWGRQLADRINDSLGRTAVNHQHVRLNRMRRKTVKTEVLYLDATDRFSPSEDLPYGPTISVMNPGGIRFVTGVMLRNILGNGLQSHTLPSLELMVETVCGGQSPAKHFHQSRPLTIVVVRRNGWNYISKVLQKLAEDAAAKHHGRIRVLPIDESGGIHDLYADEGSDPRHHLA